MLVCSLDEVWSASRRPAPQVAQPKHLLCEFSVGGRELCLPCRSRWKNHTYARWWHVLTRVPTATPRLPPFCAWASDVMPRLCPLCAHRKHSAVPGIRRADFPIPYPGLRCSTNLSASIFTHQSCGSPSLSHTLPPQCQPFPLAPGRAPLMTRQPLDAISAQSGRNPLPTTLHPSPQPLPDLRLPDTLPHTCFPF